MPIKTEILKIQEGDGRYLKKLKNHHISAMDWPLSTKFGTAMPLSLLDMVSQDNFRIFQS